MVNVDEVTLLTVPDAPPAAGPERALDPAPATPLPAAVGEGDAVVPDAEPQAAIPIAAHISTAPAVIDRLAPVESTLRSRVGADRSVVAGWWLFMVGFLLRRW